MSGTLYLVPAPLDFGCEPPLPPVTDVLPQATLEQMARLRYWITENAKTTRALLKRVNAVVPLAAPLQELQIATLPREVHKKGDHVPAQQAGAEQAKAVRALLQPALDGHDLALASEAGIPAVADPGSSVVRAAHAAGIRVVPLVGPSSLLLALAASGLNGQSFAFFGYLPQELPERAKRLQTLESLAMRSGQTQIWIETPYRNQAVFDHALQCLKPETRLCIAHGLTLPQMQIRQASVAQWRKNPLQLPPRLPAVFALGL
ncbi:MAG: SAM-dependent methyltransferase [Brachymonas denitrificans]|jgi:16S rRNA (cytidine1402-2'-O)-methyltransferase|uniref:SAM-dependent methyltransferase n=1 Tax=Brachymonas denitrificans TaxID=28220 RepID=UPI001BCC83D6|nr:SAM-dependent methyltransferase [Brachymonas denitrificans]